MRKKAYCFLALLLALAILAGCQTRAVTTTDQNNHENTTITVKDMAGREVNMPAKISSAYATSPIFTNLIYSLAPDKLAGWNFAQTPLEQKYTLPQCRELPLLGGWYGKGQTGNIEEIMNAKPDIVITGLGENVNLAEKLQQQLKIPVFCLDDSLQNYPQSIPLLGKVLGVEAQAQKMLSFYQHTRNNIDENISKIEEAKKLKLYYAEGPKGLQTDPKGSPHSQLIELVGGVNVADVKILPGYGRSEVSIEQIIKWSPDIILVGEIPFYQEIFKDGKWKNIKAVKDKKVYLIPRGPFNWFDRPPGINRIIGIPWLAATLYPDVYKMDLTEEMKKFYSIYYHYELKEDEINDLLTVQGVAG
jgi:iron complex transport system substrate-binding protein